MLAVIVIDVVVVLAGLALLGVLGLRLWHQVRDLGTAVGEAGEKLAAATQALEVGADRTPRR